MFGKQYIVFVDIFMHTFCPMVEPLFRVAKNLYKKTLLTLRESGKKSLQENITDFELGIRPDYQCMYFIKVFIFIIFIDVLRSWYD